MHSGLLGDDWSDEYEHLTGRGWDMYLYTLAQYHTHFAGRPAIYVEAEGPPSSSAAAAWPALVARLGAGGAIEVAAPVRITPPGVGPLEGVVDYATANFVGVRTRDALIRFHGRSDLGMTAAVSHHAYADLDAVQTRRGWEAWLAEVFSAVSA
jgi:hypothetical protein